MRAGLLKTRLTTFWEAFYDDFISPKPKSINARWKEIKEMKSSNGSRSGNATRLTQLVLHHCWPSEWPSNCSIVSPCALAPEVFSFVNLSTGKVGEDEATKQATSIQLPNSVLAG